MLRDQAGDASSVPLYPSPLVSTMSDAPTSSSTSESTTAARSYEQRIDRVAAIIDLIQTGKVGLNDTMTVFQEAHHLLDACEKEVEAARGIYEQITRDKL